MNILEIIDKKAKNITLSKEEINFFVNEYTNDKISDHKMSSLLMAIRINGLTDTELVDYTEALIKSGDCLEVDEKRVDKHSTGGIGDKTTIGLLPVLSAMKMKIFKITGKGLYFTGGTVDKVNSIRNFSVDLSQEQIKNNIKKIGIALIGQTKNFVPADLKIYALRDITSTVESFDLIAASIMSKKIASGAKSIIIDLKVGSGSFTPTLKDAEILAKKLKLIGEYFKRNIRIIISSMEQPLGTMLGNGVEIIEVIKILNNQSKNLEIKNLMRVVASNLYELSGRGTLKAGEKLFDKVIEDGTALEIFYKWIELQGGDVKSLKDGTFFNPKYRYIIRSNKEGYVSYPDTKAVGLSLIDLKVGRVKKTDKISYSSGIKLYNKTGDYIKKYDWILKIYSTEKISEGDLNKFKDMVHIGKAKVKPSPLILAIY